MMVCIFGGCTISVICNPSSLLFILKFQKLDTCILNVNLICAIDIHEYQDSFAELYCSRLIISALLNYYK